MYVAIEGIDTSGKSTQIELLKTIYKNAIFIQEPSDSIMGKKIRELALFGSLDNTTQALLLWQIGQIILKIFYYQIKMH